MGQKTHPLGFRLGITQKQRSDWCTVFKDYPDLLEEDNIIRTYLTKLPKLTSISNIQINRNSVTDKLEIIIESGRPGNIVGNKGKGLKKLVNKIKQLIPNSRKVNLKVIEVTNKSSNASLLADLVVDKLEKRIPFRRAIREALEKAKKNTRGIKIQVSGRLNGAEMARSEWVRKGRVPLQTLRADIDYVSKEAHTIYGILGIKVWLFKNEIFVKQ